MDPFAEFRLVMSKARNRSGGMIRARTGPFGVGR